MAQDIAFQIKQRFSLSMREKKASIKKKKKCKIKKTLPEIPLSADGKAELIIYWIFLCVSGFFSTQLGKHFLIPCFIQKNRVTITTLSF